ncbi:MAG: FAD-dependent oxidoreductase [Chloroflexi bacterium]|nr:FAD-dependent oxidoreductase [Chloroflexota bacterium]
MKPIVIVGGGVAGITLASLLSSAGKKVLVLEKEPALGGLSRTFRYDGFTFDIGPHRFYSTNEKVLGIINEALGVDTSSIQRNSAVYFLGRYHDWPLKIKSVRQLPLNISFLAFIDLFTKNFRKYSDSPSFENYILTKYGRTLYLTYFKEYSEKFLGISPANTHWHWAKMGVERATISDKITTGNLSSLFKLMLMPSPKQLDFIYSPSGCDAFCLKLAEKIRNNGGTILTNSAPDSIVCEGDRIAGITWPGGETEVDKLVWTGSLRDLEGLLGLSGHGLDYIDLVVYNVELSEPLERQFQWCYYGAKEIIFSRVSNPLNFAQGLTPQGKGSLCVEVTCRKGDPVWNEPEKLIDRVINDMVKTDTVKSKNHVEKVHVERVADAYPVYDLNYQEKFERLNSDLKLKNLQLAGRTGLYWYNNMDHSIENALDIYNNFMKEGL